VKPQLWVPVAAFLAVSLPTVLLLQALGWADEYRLWIAIIAGGLATAIAQSRLTRREDKR
jgi:hypothetical protein